eukprot:scaffold294079_cov28-Tisochrysis_lutea.AAC.1
MAPTPSVGDLLGTELATEGGFEVGELPGLAAQWELPSRLAQAQAEAEAAEAEARKAEAAAAAAEAALASEAVTAEASLTKEKAVAGKEVEAAPEQVGEEPSGFFGAAAVSSWSGFMGSSGLMDGSGLSGLQAKLKSAASDASGALKAAANDAGGAIKAASSEAARAAAAAAKAAAASANGERLLKTTICEFLVISGEQAPAGASSEVLAQKLRARGLQLVRWTPTPHRVIACFHGPLSGCSPIAIGVLIRHHALPSVDKCTDQYVTADLHTLENLTCHGLLLLRLVPFSGEICRVTPSAGREDGEETNASSSCGH